MKKIVLLILLISFIPISNAGEKYKIRTFKNDNVGIVSLTAPSIWTPSEHHNIRNGTTFYYLSPPKEGDFGFEIRVNSLKYMRINDLVEGNLKKYLESSMAKAVSQSIEGKVKTKNFGENNKGMYARLTDKAPKKGEFQFYTHGVKLFGNNAVLFSFYSNNQDEEILNEILKVIESIQIKK